MKEGKVKLENNWILLLHILALISIALLVNLLMTWLLLFFHEIFSSYITQTSAINNLSLTTTHSILLDDYIFLYISAYLVPIIIAVLIQYPLLKTLFKKEPEISIDNQGRLIRLPIFISRVVFFGWLFSIVQIVALILLDLIPLDGFIITNLATQFTISIAAYSLTFFITNFYNKKAFDKGFIHLNDDLIKSNVQLLGLDKKIKTVFYSVSFFPCAIFSVVMYFLLITNDSDFISSQYHVVFITLIISLLLGMTIIQLLLLSVKQSLNTLSNATTAIEKGDFNLKLNITSTDELSLLMNNLNHMAFEINNLNKEIVETQKEIIFTMGAIGESRSKETGNHVIRVSEYSKLLAIEYGMSKEEADILKLASPMHDIGKVAIPDSILNKAGKLTPEEREIMNTHAELGYDMLKNSEREILRAAAIVANEHHEKWDGTGYPNKKSATDIHIYGRITAIADVFDALGSRRVYKECWSDERIFNLLREEQGKHFDPKLIDIFFEKFEKFNEIRNEFSD